MYVCLCNGLTDRDIRQAAGQGHCDVEGAYRSLDCSVNCGRCIPMAAELLTRREDTVPMQAAE